MKLHNEVKLLENLIRAASQKTGISTVFVEKDYWIDAGTPENLQALRAYLAENTGYWSQASNRP